MENLSITHLAPRPHMTNPSDLTMVLRTYVMQLSSSPIPSGIYLSLSRFLLFIPFPPSSGPNINFLCLLLFSAGSIRRFLNISRDCTFYSNPLVKPPRQFKRHRATHLIRPATSCPSRPDLKSPPTYIS